MAENDNTQASASEINGVGGSAEALVKVSEDLVALQDKFLRLQADFDNYRKRMTKERADLFKYGHEQVVMGVLDVADNFDRAMASAAKGTDMATLMQGLVMVHKQMQDMLAAQGVTKIAVKGQVFDPLLHEAVSHEASDDVKEGHVVSELQSGYKLHDKVIRCAKVSVAHKKAEHGGQLS